MGLDLKLREGRPEIVWCGSITHNLTAMAEAAGLYECMWRPEECKITLAWEMVEPLTLGLDAMIKNEVWLKTMNPQNGYGSYDGLLRVAEKYLAACEEHPNATVEACR